MSELESKIIVGKGKNKIDILSKIFQKFGDIKTKLKESSKVFILIDLSIPEGYPNITSHELLQKIINLVSEANPREINIGAVPKYGIASKYIWNSLGFNKLLNNDKVHFVELDKISNNAHISGNTQISETKESSDVKEIAENTEEMVDINTDSKNINYGFPKNVKDCDFFISLVNPKVNPIDGFDLGIMQSAALIASRDKLIDSALYNERIKIISQIYEEKKPDLLIYDLTNIIARAGPQYYSDSKIVNSDYLIIANSAPITDYLVMKMFGIEPNENALIEFIKNSNPSCFDTQNLSQFIVIEDEGNSNYKEMDKLKEIQNLFQSTEEISLKSINLSQIPIPKTLTLDEILPNNVELCLGEINSRLTHSLYEFLYLLKSSLIKDIENMLPLTIMAGKNPRDPETAEKDRTILIFGDDAIKDTEDKKFRIITKQKEITPEEELEKKRIIYQGGIRQKILDWESIKPEKIEQINDQYEEPEKREKALASLDKKEKKLREKMDNKLKKFEAKQIKKHDKEIEKAKKIKYKYNKKVYEIPGNPPKVYENLTILIDVFGKSWLPTLDFWNSIIKLYVDTHQNKEKYKQFLKERKDFKKKLLESYKE